MFPSETGLLGRLTPFALSLAFTVIVTIVGNDVLAAYGGVLVFVVVLAAVILYTDRRHWAPRLNRS